MTTCPKCGVENPEGVSACRMCGSTIGTGVRHCVSCGRSIDFNSNVCPYCGHDYRVTLQGPASKSLSTGMRVLLYLASFFVFVAGIVIGIVFITRDDPEYKRVGKICIILGIVSVLLNIGLAALLYFMVLNFGGDGLMATPTTGLSRTPVADGVMFTLLPVSPETVWSDVSIVLDDGYSIVHWTPLYEELTGGSVVMEEYPARILSDLSVVLTITDLEGNGILDLGDRMTITSSPAFSASTTYTFTLRFDPTDGEMCVSSFSG